MGKLFRFQWEAAFIEHSPDNTSAFAVGMFIAHHLGPGRTCYPGQKRIMKATHQSKHTVIKAVALLVSEGWIKKTKLGACGLQRNRN